MSGDLTAAGFENELTRSIRDLSYGIRRDIQKGMFLVTPNAQDKRSVESIVNRLADLFINEKNGQNVLRVSKKSDLDILNKAFPGMAKYLIDSYRGGIIASDNNQHLIGEQLLAEQIRRLEAENTTNSILNKWSHLLYEGIDNKIYDFTLNPIYERQCVNVNPTFERECVNVNPSFERECVNVNQTFERERVNVNPIFERECENINPICERVCENINPICERECVNDNPIIRNQNFTRIESCKPVYSFTEAKPLENSTLIETSPLINQKNCLKSTRKRRNLPISIPIPVKHSSPTKSVYFSSDSLTYPEERSFKNKETKRSANFIDEYVDKEELERLEEELDSWYEKYQDELSRINDSYSTGRKKLDIISEVEEFDESDDDEYIREELKRPLTRLSNYSSSLDITSRNDQKFRSDFDYGRSKLNDNNNLCKRKLRNENIHFSAYPTKESYKKEQELQKRKPTKLRIEKKLPKYKSSSPITNSTEIEFEQEKKVKEKSKKPKSSLKSNCKKCLNKICRLSSSKDSKGESMPLYI